MSKTGSRAALLQVCIQDLYAGRRRAAKRLGRIASHAGPALTSAIFLMRESVSVSMHDQ